MRKRAMGREFTMSERAMGLEITIRKRDGMRVHHKEERWGESSALEKE